MEHTKVAGNAILIQIGFSFMKLKMMYLFFCYIVWAVIPNYFSHMSNVADACICSTWYTNSMKKCEKPSREQSVGGFCYVWR